MACWQDLYRMLLDETMPPERIVSALGVKPSRLKQMLASKRLAAALTGTEAVAERMASHAAASSVASAVEKLAALTACAKPETARRACLDMLAAARQARRPDSTPILERLHRLYHRMNRRREVAAGRSARQALQAEPAPPGSDRARHGAKPAVGGPVIEPSPPARAAAGRDASTQATPQTTPPRKGNAAESILTEAEARKRFRQEIIDHGGVYLARRRQLGR